MNTEIDRVLGQTSPIGLSEFLKIEDDDLKKFIYKNVPIEISNDIRKVDNEEKLAYYKFSVSININNQGKFYTKSNLTEWIVYNKETKKVKTSKVQNMVSSALLSDYFSDRDLVGLFIHKLTNTLIKKIIENKIKPIGDVLRYHRSYTIKRKDVKLETVGRFLLAGQLSLINSIEDPDNVKNIYSLDRNTLSIMNEVRSCRAFKFRSDEISQLKNKYEKWNREQSHKYVAFKRSRDEQNGNHDVNESIK